MVMLLILVVTLGFILYKLSTKNFGYWKKRGVPYLEPTPIFGNFFDVFVFRMTIGHYLAKCYNQFKTPYFGLFVMNTPHLIIKDPNLIKAILVKDFNYFPDRTIVSDEKCDSLASKFLFLVKNPEWKYMRTKMSPVFSSGKLKNMMSLINAAGEEMKTYLYKNFEKKSIEAKEVCAKYSTDVIASCAFGIDAHCFQDENAEFRVIARKIFGLEWANSIRQTCYFIAPSIVKLLRLPFFEPSVTNFMREVFWKTLEEREKTNSKRNDVIDIIAQMKKQSTSNTTFEFVGDRVVAQAGQFYAAGFETVSSTLSFTLYELCLHPEIQTKLRSEIKDTIAERGGFTYDAIQRMKYMNMVVCETLRKYPVLPFLDRMCIEDYKIPDSNLVIEKGTPIYIPMFGLHYDEEYFPDPEKYDPERFSEENKSKVPPFVYIPFGEGPRVCIGERFGLMGVKLGLAHVLSEFEIERSSDTPVPLEYETKSFLLFSKVGLPLKFKKIISDAA